MGLKGKHRLKHRQDRLLAALDVGSSKISCFVAQVTPDNEIHVKGAGLRPSLGVRGGAIVDMEETQSAVAAALDMAEGMASEKIEDVIVSFSAGNPRSQIVEASVPVNGHGVLDTDIEKVLQKAGDSIDLGERHLVHAFPACYSVDESIGVRAPIGMFGGALEVALHVIDANPGPLRNLANCVAGAHINPSTMVLAPYASGIATLVEDEMNLGAACIDMGAGTTGISIFAGGAMVAGDVVPMGSHSITEAIARELVTSIRQAERLKTYHGNAVAAGADGQELIDVPLLGEGDAGEEEMQAVPKSALTNIIEPRIVRILEAVGERLRQCGFDDSAGRRVVLTGGGSGLTGLQDLAQKVLGKHVRIGKPVGVRGLPENMRGPEFATCAGLLLYALNAPLEMGEQHTMPAVEDFRGNVLARLGEWFKGSF